MINKPQTRLVNKLESKYARYFYKKLQQLGKELVKRIESEQRSDIQQDVIDIVELWLLGVKNKMDKDVVAVYMLWPKYVKKATDLKVDLEKINLEAVKWAENFKTFKPWLVEGSIGKTTIEKTGKIIADGIFEWQTYTQIAETMEKQLDKWLFSLARAETIAIHTIRHAYESGRYQTMKELKQQGMVVKKRWSTVWDDRVTEWCKANEARGMILMNQSFPSWDQEAPRSGNIRCRCTVNYDIT